MVIPVHQFYKPFKGSKPLKGFLVVHVDSFEHIPF
jgi:hypothetical protein